MYYRLSIVSTNKINYDKLKILNHDSNIFLFLDGFSNLDAGFMREFSDLRQKAIRDEAEGRSIGNRRKIDEMQMLSALLYADKKKSL